MDFKAAEEQYRWITDQYQRGAINPAQYQAKIEQLKVRDPSGRLWMLQAGSGKWYVFQNGTWVPGQPYPPNPPVTPPFQEVKKTKSKKKPWAFALIAGVVMLLCLCVTVGGGYYAYRSGDLAWLLEQLGLNDLEIIEQLTAEETDLSLIPSQTLTVYPGQSQVIDPSSRAELLLPIESLPEGESGRLVISDPNPKLRKELESIFQQKSSFYSLAAQTETDGAGSAQFSLPATGEPLFLLEIFDEKYVSLSPVDTSSGAGAFSVPVRSGLTGEGNDSLDFNGSYAFSLVSPITTSHLPPDIVMVSHHSQPDPRDCGVSVNTVPGGYMQKPTYVTSSVCRKNASGTVRVMYFPPDTPKVTSAQADQVVDLVEKIMAAYQNEKFAAANLQGTGARVNVVVQKGSGDPHYSPCNGMIYIPEDSLGSANLENELAHESAHWVQDEEYNMTGAYWKNKLSVSSAETWWLETSAEYMATLYKPDYLEHNLATYGPTNPADGKTPFQFAPNQWNDQLYVHLQMLKVFVCENAAVCPINDSRFKEAINNGTYPFDSTAIDLVSKNLGEYARYLLGKSPQQANSAIYIMGTVTSGKGYGDFAAPKMDKDLSSFERIGYQPQMKLVDGKLEKEVLIEAAIEKGGVYPLMLGLPINPDNTGAPAMIEIEPSTPYYYRLGDGEVQFNPGNSKVILGPVHSALGLNKVRLVAVAGDGPKVFKAKIKSLNLQGDWFFLADTVINNGVVCDHQGDGNVTVHTESMPTLTSYLTSLPATVSGVYTRDAAGNSYTWIDDPAADHSYMEQGDSSYIYSISGSSLVDNTGIIIESSYSIHRSQSHRPQKNLEVVFASSAALVMLVLYKQKKVSLALVALSLVFLLSACGGFASIEGDLHTSTKLDKLTPSEGKTIAQLVADTGADASNSGFPITGYSPVYIVSGVTTATVDLIVTAGASAMDETQQSTSHCVGTMTYRVNGYFFEDGVVKSMSDLQGADSDD